MYISEWILFLAAPVTVLLGSILWNWRVSNVFWRTENFFLGPALSNISAVFLVGTFLAEIERLALVKTVFAVIGLVVWVSVLAIQTGIYRRNAHSVTVSARHRNEMLGVWSNGLGLSAYVLFVAFFKGDIFIP